MTNKKDGWTQPAEGEKKPAAKAPAKTKAPAKPKAEEAPKKEAPKAEAPATETPPEAPQDAPETEEAPTPAETTPDAPPEPETPDEPEEEIPAAPGDDTSEADRAHRRSREAALMRQRVLAQDAHTIIDSIMGKINEKERKFLSDALLPKSKRRMTDENKKALAKRLGVPVPAKKG